MREILHTGGLIVGSSEGFTQMSSYLHLGCAQCGAAVHICCPYLNSDGDSGVRVRRTGAIDWHLTNFLFDPGQQRRKLAMCSAERAYCGAKLGD